jgi:hypothetical protein
MNLVWISWKNHILHPACAVRVPRYVCYGSRRGVPGDFSRFLFFVLVPVPVSVTGSGLLFQDLIFKCPPRFLFWFLASLAWFHRLALAARISLWFGFC